MGQFTLKRLLGSVAGFCAMCAYWRFLLAGPWGGLAGIQRLLFEAVLVFVVFGTGVWVRFGKGWTIVFWATAVFLVCRIISMYLANGHL